MEDCIFCKIAEKKIPSTAVYEDDKVLAFKDADPQAPTHVLIIPKTHIKNILEVAEDSGLMNHIFGVINKLADELGLKDAGFRVVANTTASLPVYISTIPLTSNNAINTIPTVNAFFFWFMVLLFLTRKLPGCQN